MKFNKYVIRMKLAVGPNYQMKFKWNFEQSSIFGWNLIILPILQMKLEIVSNFEMKLKAN